MNINLRYHKWVIAWVAVLVSFTLPPCKTLGQDAPPLAGRMRVGVMHSPPFEIKTADGQWEGLSLELWRMVAKELALDFELYEYSGIQPLQDALEKRELDITPTAVVTQSREILFDFSNPYYRSGSAIAVSVESSGFHWFRLADLFFSPGFLKMMGCLTLLLLSVGAVVWTLERRRNGEMFDARPLRGIGHGAWWAAVTMTTVGYGDKAPKTMGGRMVAISWMIVSIVLVSVFTASITTSLTISQLSGKVRDMGDLHSVRVGSIGRSPTLNILLERGISVFPFVNSQDGLQAIVDNQIDAFVYDQAVLKYLVSKQFPSQLHVLPEIFTPYYASMAMPPGSPLLEQINRSMLKMMATPDWLKLKDRYLGSGH